MNEPKYKIYRFKPIGMKAERCEIQTNDLQGIRKYLSEKYGGVRIFLYYETNEPF